MRPIFGAGIPCGVPLDSGDSVLVACGNGNSPGMTQPCADVDDVASFGSLSAPTGVPLVFTPMMPRRMRRFSIGGVPPSLPPCGGADVAAGTFITTVGADVTSVLLDCAALEPS